jgi:hypothetical protein
LGNCAWAVGYNRTVAFQGNTLEVFQFGWVQFEGKQAATFFGSNFEKFGRARSCGAWNFSG